MEKVSIKKRKRRKDISRKELGGGENTRDANCCEAWKASSGGIANEWGKHRAGTNN